VTTQSDGRFSYDLKSKDIGDLRIQASWSGNSDYSGDTSNNANVFILPWYIIELTAAAIIAIILCIAIYRATGSSKRKKQTIEIPQLEENPSE
jgi:hypothetical protein